MKQFVAYCSDCQIFTNEKTHEPEKPHNVPEKCWSEVAVDLFGPMPSSNHIVVVQDLASRYPAAKILSSTKASKVIPALADIYDAYGNPETQLSDKRPPFNSAAVKQFTENMAIEQKNIPSLHPSSNPVETFMKPVGKTMKIARHNKVPEREALQQLLTNYRDTPHPATKITPSTMLFGGPPNSSFPRISISEDEIKEARARDTKLKSIRESYINSSKYKTPSNFNIGDKVLIRNFNKSSKYDPYFQSKPCIVKDMLQNNLFLECSDTLYKRHPDDVKFYHGESEKNEIATNEDDQLKKWHNLRNAAPPYYEDYNSDDVENNNPRYEADNSTLPTRSTRDKKRTHDISMEPMIRLDTKRMDKDLCYVIIDNSMTLTLEIFQYCVLSSEILGFELFFFVF